MRCGMVFMIALASLVIACGGSSYNAYNNPSPTGPPVTYPGGATGLNTLAVTVDTGPAAAPGAVNTLYTSVTVCAPGSATACQTINHVQVDTGSTGFRVLASALGN